VSVARLRVSCQLETSLKSLKARAMVDLKTPQPRIQTAIVVQLLSKTKLLESRIKMRMQSDSEHVFSNLGLIRKFQIQNEKRKFILLPTLN